MCIGFVWFVLLCVPLALHVWILFWYSRFGKKSGFVFVFVYTMPFCLMEWMLGIFGFLCCLAMGKLCNCYMLIFMLHWKYEINSLYAKKKKSWAWSALLIIVMVHSLKKFSKHFWWIWNEYGGFVLSFSWMTLLSRLKGKITDFRHTPKITSLFFCQVLMLDFQSFAKSLFFSFVGVVFIMHIC